MTPLYELQRWLQGQWLTLARADSLANLQRLRRDMRESAAADGGAYRVVRVSFVPGEPDAVVEQIAAAGGAA